MGVVHPLEQGKHIIDLPSEKNEGVVACLTKLQVHKSPVEFFISSTHHVFQHVNGRKGSRNLYLSVQQVVSVWSQMK